jgi:uncharacterized protein YqeY
MDSLSARVRADLNAARKAHDKPLVLLLGTTLADIKNREIELGREPSDDEVVDVLRKGIKRRRESVDLYQKAGRAELAEKEGAEVRALEQYLPAQVSDDDIRTAVRAAIASGATTVGAVMGKVMPQFKGRADGARMNAIVREELNKQD